MMSMRLHSQWMKVAPDCIYATGGASDNVPLLQVMADVMNCRVLRIEVAKSAALGAALRPRTAGWFTPAKTELGKNCRRFHQADSAAKSAQIPRLPRSITS